MCGLAPIAVAATLLTGPMCPRLDRAPAPTMELVVAALRGDALPATAMDPAFAAAIRALKPSESMKAAPRRKHRR